MRRIGFSRQITCMSIRKVRIKLLEDQKLGVLYCPVCGVVIHSKDISPACKHVVFSYIDLVGDFDTIAPKLRAVVNKARKIAEQGETDVVDAVLNLIDSETMFCLEVVEGGEAAGGPYGGSVYLGIDFSP